MQIRKGLYKKGITALVIIPALLYPQILLSTPGKRTYIWDDVQKGTIVSEEPAIENEQELSQEDNIQEDEVYEEKDSVYENKILLTTPREKAVVERLREYELEKKKITGENNIRVIKIDATPWELENRKALAREKIRGEILERVRSYPLEGGMHEEM